MSEPTTTPVYATWSISLDTDCPKCGKYVDLLQADDFWDGRHLELGEHGTERSKAVEVECPECHHEFEVTCEY